MGLRVRDLVYQIGNNVALQLFDVEVRVRDGQVRVKIKGSDVGQDEPSLSRDYDLHVDNFFFRYLIQLLLEIYREFLIGQLQDVLFGGVEFQLMELEVLRNHEDVPVVFVTDLVSYKVDVFS